MPRWRFEHCFHPFDPILEEEVLKPPVLRQSSNQLVEGLLALRLWVLLGPAHDPLDHLVNLALCR